MGLDERVLGILFSYVVSTLRESSHNRGRRKRRSQHLRSKTTVRLRLRERRLPGPGAQLREPSFYLQRSASMQPRTDRPKYQSIDPYRPMLTTRSFTRNMRRGKFTRDPIYARRKRLANAIRVDTDRNRMESSAVPLSHTHRSHPNPPSNTGWNYI